MKKIILLTFLLLTSFAFAQKNSDKEQIQQVMKDFLDAIKEQDSAKFNRLFHDDPVSLDRNL